MSLKIVIALAYSVVIPAFVGGLNLASRRNNERAITILSWIFILSFVFELLATASRIIFHNNIIVLCAGFVVDGWLLMYFLGIVLNDRRIFLYGSLMITFVALVEFLLKGVTFLNVAFTIKNLLAISGFGLLIFRVSRGHELNRWIFYVTGIFLFYFVSSFLYFLFISPQMEKGLLMFTSNIHIVVNAFCNLLFGLALWKLCFTNTSLLHS